MCKKYLKYDEKVTLKKKELDDGTTLLNYSSWIKQKCGSEGVSKALKSRKNFLKKNITKQINSCVKSNNEKLCLTNGTKKKV